MTGGGLLTLLQAAAEGGATRVDVALTAAGAELRFDGALPHGARLRQGVDEALDAGARRVEVDAQVYTLRGAPPTPTGRAVAAGHRIAIVRGFWQTVFGRSVEADVKLLKERCGYQHPDICVNGESLYAESCEGAPSLHFATSSEPVLTLEKHRRYQSLDVDLPPPGFPVGIFVALADWGPGRIRYLCSGVLVDRKEFPDMPGVRALVSSPHKGPGPDLDRLVRQVWLEGLLHLETDRRKVLLWPLRHWLEHPPRAGSAEEAVFRRLSGLPLLSAAQGCVSLDFARSRKVYLHEGNFEAEAVLEAAGLPYAYAGDLHEGPGVRPSERKRALGVDFGRCAGLVLPLADGKGGLVKFDPAARTATLVTADATRTLHYSRVEKDEKEQRGDLKIITWFWLLVADEREAWTFEDVEKEYYEQLPEPTGRWGVRAPWESLYATLRSGL